MSIRRNSGDALLIGIGIGLAVLLLVVVFLFGVPLRTTAPPAMVPAARPMGLVPITPPPAEQSEPVEEETQ